MSKLTGGKNEKSKRVFEVKNYVDKWFSNEKFIT